MSKRVIYKYPIVGHDPIFMPEQAQILHFDFQLDTPTLWALVDLSEPLEGRTFTVVGTGWELDVWGKHIGTSLQGDFVWHCFEINNTSPAPIEDLSDIDGSLR